MTPLKLLSAQINGEKVVWLPTRFSLDINRIRIISFLEKVEQLRQHLLERQRIAESYGGYYETIKQTL